jgi:hypothetical protein
MEVRSDPGHIMSNQAVNAENIGDQQLYHNNFGRPK